MYLSIIVFFIFSADQIVCVFPLNLAIIGDDNVGISAKKELYDISFQCS